jgi:hypothetical protein
MEANGLRISWGNTRRHFTDQGQTFLSFQRFFNGALIRQVGYDKHEQPGKRVNIFNG